jgi:nitrite reductase/ring-hydroxylating ferredoxin subunit
MMDEHIAIGRKYPSVKLNTTYSYGLDDQEFVVAFETDEPSDFLDLVMELRETEGSTYTERDTPIFTCIAMSLRDALDSLGAPEERMEWATPFGNSRVSDWVRVADVSEAPTGASKVVYLQGEQVALFNIEGEVYAVGNRCPHSNGPLAEGEVEGTTVTCPWHGSRFDLITCEPLSGPANKPLTKYRVKIENASIFLAPVKDASIQSVATKTLDS